MVKPAGRDATQAALIFVGLLEGNADLPRQGLQCDANMNAGPANLGGYLLIDQSDRLFIHVGPFDRRPADSAEMCVQTSCAAHVPVRLSVAAGATPEAPGR